MFIIDDDNALTYYATVPAETSGLVIESQKDLTDVAEGWPINRLVEIWNGFAGAPPFGDLKPVKKFENKTKAVRRIWEAIQKLIGDGGASAESAEVKGPVPVAALKNSKKLKVKAAVKPKKAAAKGERVTMKDTVIALISRRGGATLDEIIKATNWLPHTTRAFLSTLPKKGGPQVNSTRREKDGARVYEVVR